MNFQGWKSLSEFVESGSDSAPENESEKQPSLRTHIHEEIEKEGLFLRSWRTRKIYLPPQFNQGEFKVVDDHLLLIYGVSGSKETLREE